MSSRTGDETIVTLSFGAIRLGTGAAEVVTAERCGAVPSPLTQLRQMHRLRQGSSPPGTDRADDLLSKLFLTVFASSVVWVWDRPGLFLTTRLSTVRSFIRLTLMKRPKNLQDRRLNGRITTD
jgi:hypothetical protein